MICSTRVCAVCLMLIATLFSLRTPDAEKQLENKPKKVHLFVSRFTALTVSSDLLSEGCVWERIPTSKCPQMTTTSIFLISTMNSLPSSVRLYYWPSSAHLIISIRCNKSSRLCLLKKRRWTRRQMYMWWRCLWSKQEWVGKYTIPPNFNPIPRGSVKRLPPVEQGTLQPTIRVEDCDCDCRGEKVSVEL